VRSSPLRPVLYHVMLSWLAGLVLALSALALSQWLRQLHNDIPRAPVSGTGTSRAATVRRPQEGGLRSAARSRPGPGLCRRWRALASTCWMDRKTSPSAKLDYLMAPSIEATDATSKGSDRLLARTRRRRLALLLRFSSVGDGREGATGRGAGAGGWLALILFVGDGREGAAGLADVDSLSFSSSTTITSVRVRGSR